MSSSNTPTSSDAGAAPRSFRKARLVSLVALCASVCGVGYVAKTGYHIATDSFVVPVVLSPDSDLVTASKLSRSTIQNERARITAQKEQIEAELYAAEKAIEELKALEIATASSLAWTTVVTSTQVASSNGDLRALTRQQEQLASMIEAQEALVERVKKELDAGLTSKADLAREVHSLGQMRISAIDAERSRINTQSQLQQLAMTQRAIAGGQGGRKLATPEMVAQQGQLVRVRCDVLKLEAERRSKTSERRHIDEELVKLDELLAQLNKRPIFRAIDMSTNIAFIPYSQMEGVAPGERVFECVWGVFACTPVGRVQELLPGEVIVPDPWGTLARGQYAVIGLDDQHAAQSKTLRVRPSGSKPVMSAPATKHQTVANK